MRVTFLPWIKSQINRIQSQFFTNILVHTARMFVFSKRLTSLKLVRTGMEKHSQIKTQLK